MKAFISPAQSPTNFVGSWAGSETCSGTEHPGWTLTPDCTTPLRENAAVHHSKIDCRMAATGQSRRFGEVCDMSALPPTTAVMMQCHERQKGAMCGRLRVGKENLHGASLV